VPEKIRLIVNADDFGQSEGINHGVIEAHERGIVTSASLMVRWPAAAEAAAYSRRNPKLSAGLHVDLGEWTYRDGAWAVMYQVVPLEDRRAIYEEISRQLAMFRDLVGRNPTHLDSHQHVHQREPVRSILLEVARDLGVPLRHCTPSVRYCGEFYGQDAQGSPLPSLISVKALIAILEGLESGITELSCHPSTAVELNTMYGAGRRQELETLCHPQVRASLASFGIELCSFGSIRRDGSGQWA
jgi:predicted glycoside hydrolase/deacetylase ChbG (UPF0249 family)